MHYTTHDQNLPLVICAFSYKQPYLLSIRMSTRVRERGSLKWWQLAKQSREETRRIELYLPRWCHVCISDFWLNSILYAQIYTYTRDIQSACTFVCNVCGRVLLPIERIGLNELPTTIQFILVRIMHSAPLEACYYRTQLSKDVRTKSGMERDRWVN